MISRLYKWEGTEEGITLMKRRVLYNLWIERVDYLRADNPTLRSCAYMEVLSTVLPVKISI